jgi:uncharacterized protein (TIGR03437 family)
MLLNSILVSWIGPKMYRKFASVLWIAAFLVWQAHAQTSGNWTKQSPKTSAPTRAFLGMAFDSAHSQVVLFGGQDPNFHILNDTWVWDGSNWTQKTPPSSPPARSEHNVAFDAAHGQIVLFGGQQANGTQLGDTWVWDGSNWTQKSPQTSPSARSGHGMAYDAAHGQVVIFAGQDAAGNALGDTWVWDGSNWTQKSPQTSPPLNYGGVVMAYDAVHSQVVLFGGTDVNNNYLNATWIWNGVNWTQKTPSTIPPGRVDAGMAYDAAHGQAVMFGGSFANTVLSTGPGLNDTWVWDGMQWTKESPQTQPPLSQQHSMAYDSVHGQVVLFGGDLTDTWTWTGASAALIPTITSLISASGFGGFSSVTPGGWVEIYGINLAPDTREWAGSDFNGNSAPTALDGVEVTIGGQKAFVEYISSTGQINAQLPSNIPAGGALGVTVTNGSQTTSPFNVNVNSAEPGLLAPAAFLIGGKQYAVAILPDGSYVLPAGAIAGVASRPAHPGETITLYGIGFGSVVPSIPAGQIVTASNQLAASLQILFGQTSAQLAYDGLAPQYVGLYQFNVVVPAVPDNDLVPITFNLGGVAGTQTLYLAVHQ